MILVNLEFRKAIEKYPKKRLKIWILCTKIYRQGFTSKRLPGYSLLKVTWGADIVSIIILNKEWKPAIDPPFKLHKKVPLYFFL